MMNDESRKRAHILHYSLFILHYPLFFIIHSSFFIISLFFIYKGKVTTPVSAHVDI